MHFTNSMFMKPRKGTRRVRQIKADHKAFYPIYNSKNYTKLENKIVEMSSNPKLYNSLKFLIHSLKDDLRTSLIKVVCENNFILAANIIRSMLTNTDEEETYLVECIKLTIDSCEVRLPVNAIASLIILSNYDEFVTEIIYNFADIQNIYLKHDLIYLYDLLDCKGILFVANILAEHGCYYFYSDYISQLKIKYNHKYASCLKKLIKTLYLGQHYDVIRQILNNLDVHIINELPVIVNKSSQTVEKEIRKDILLYCSYMHGLNEDTVNDFAPWKAVFADKFLLGNKRYIKYLIGHYFGNRLKVLNFNEDIIRYISQSMGIPIFTDIKKNLAFFKNNKIRAAHHLKLEPYNSMYLDEKLCVTFLKKAEFYNPYKHKIQSIRLQKFKKDEFKAYELIDKIVDQYSSFHNILFVYLNSPLKYFVEFNYILRKAVAKFTKADIVNSCNKFMIRGRIAEFNGGISFNPSNIWVKDGTQSVDNYNENYSKFSKDINKLFFIYETYDIFVNNEMVKIIGKCIVDDTSSYNLRLMEGTKYYVK